MSSLILRTATRFMIPLLLLFSLFLLLRGHNQPGGGFSGGLIAAAGFVLYGLAYSAQAAKRVLVIHPTTLLGTGLLLAVASGMASVLLGRAFMTGVWYKLSLPDQSQIDLGSPVFFDIGVYLVVIGTVMSIILPLLED